MLGFLACGGYKCDHWPNTSPGSKASSVFCRALGPHRCSAGVEGLQGCLEQVPTTGCALCGLEGPTWCWRHTFRCESSLRWGRPCCVRDLWLLPHSAGSQLCVRDASLGPGHFLNQCNLPVSFCRFCFSILDMNVMLHHCCSPIMLSWT